MTARILIMAGGTGGHVFPALAVADALRVQQHDVVWMGTEHGIEAKLVPAAAYPITYIHVKGLRGNGVLGWLLAPFKLLKAIYEAITAIRAINPDVVLGLGGFASGPGGFAAWLLRKPLVIHEQNAIPGLTNKVLSHVATHVLQGFRDAFSTSKSAQWVGNPVRHSIEVLASPESRFATRSGSMRILVLGGSLGAKALNTILPPAMALLSEQHQIDIKHQCGQRHVSDCQQNYQHAKVNAEVSAFIDDMAAAYEWADLVICRAGALTVAELAAAGVGAVLIPYPYAVDDHQTYNAAALVSAGAAYLMPENTLTVESLVYQLRPIMNDRTQLLAMAVAARSQAKVGTANTIAAICLKEVTHG